MAREPWVLGCILRACDCEGCEKRCVVPLAQKLRGTIRDGDLVEICVDGGRLNIKDNSPSGSDGCETRFGG